MYDSSIETNNETTATTSEDFLPYIRLSHLQMTMLVEHDKKVLVSEHGSCTKILKEDAPSRSPGRSFGKSITHSYIVDNQKAMQNP